MIDERRTFCLARCLRRRYVKLLCTENPDAKGQKRISQNDLSNQNAISASVLLYCQTVRQQLASSLFPLQTTIIFAHDSFENHCLTAFTDSKVSASIFPRTLIVRLFSELIWLPAAIRFKNTVDCLYLICGQWGLTFIRGRNIRKRNNKLAFMDAK